MLNVTVANIGEFAVVGCEGRIVQSESAYKLRVAQIIKPHSRHTRGYEYRSELLREIIRTDCGAKQAPTRVNRLAHDSFAVHT
jgi:hypothetical protein